MKIVFISPGVLPMPPVRGGAIENLIDAFVKQNELSKEHSITVFGIYSRDAEEASKKYRHCTFKYIKLDKFSVGFRYIINRISPLKIGNAYIHNVKKELETIGEYDVIIVENRAEYAIPLFKVAKGKLILHLHNDILNIETKNATKILSCYEKVFTVSNYIKSRVLTIKDTDKVVTLYNGIDSNKFDKNNYTSIYESERTKYSISKEDTVILYTGRVIESKGVKELIEAFIQLTEYKNVKLLIVGSANFGESVTDAFLLSIKELAQKAKENIIFTGYIDYDRLPILYSIADISVIPSIGIEAAGQTVLEASSTGNAIITSDSGGIPELIGCNGIIIRRDENFVDNLSTHLRTLIDDKELREYLGRNAKVNARNFDDKIYFDDFCKLIDKKSKE